MNLLSKTLACLALATTIGAANAADVSVTLRQPDGEYIVPDAVANAHMPTPCDDPFYRWYRDGDPLPLSAITAAPTYTIRASELARGRTYRFHRFTHCEQGCGLQATSDYVTVIVPLDNDATLSSIVSTAGTLLPTFAPATLAYTLCVENSVDTITLTGIPSHPAATVEGNARIPLQVGSNVVTLTVKAEDNTTKTYTVTVRRSSIVEGSVTHLGNTYRTKIYGTLEWMIENVKTANLAGCTPTPIDGGSYGRMYPWSCAPSACPTNWVLPADADFTNLTTVLNTEIPCAWVDWNSGYALAGYGLNGTHNNTGRGHWWSSTGSSTSSARRWHVDLNATSGGFETNNGAFLFSVRCIRKLSNDATLKSLTTSSGTIAPAFAPNVTSYTVCVDEDKGTISITGVPNHDLATVVAGNQTSYPVPPAGTSTINTITVMAEDGTQKNYTLTVCSMAPHTPMAIGGETSFIDLGNGEYDEVHVFTTSANATTLTSKLTMKCVPSDVKIFIVAGGGGGGKSVGTAPGWPSSGGGAGGVILALAAGTAFTVGDYTINVGKGGNAGNINPGGNNDQKRAYVHTYNGGNSSIVGPGINLVAIGGGGGAWHQAGNGCPGGIGGSGGGGYTGATGGGAGTATQGTRGGTHGDYNNAGGGGYSAVAPNTGGSNSTTSSKPAAGGKGIDYTAVPALAGVSLNGVPLVGYNGGFAGGGSGGGNNSVATHGGGQRAGTNNTGGPGVKDTGGGGSGGLNTNGYTGGSGIVVVRFRYISTP